MIHLGNVLTKGVQNWGTIMIRLIYYEFGEIFILILPTSIKIPKHNFSKTSLQLLKYARLCYFNILAVLWNFLFQNFFNGWEILIAWTDSVSTTFFHSAWWHNSYRHFTFRFFHFNSFHLKKLWSEFGIFVYRYQWINWNSKTS